MSTITSVGIREFRPHLYKYTKENQEPIALTSHGKTIGAGLRAASRKLGGHDQNRHDPDHGATSSVIRYTLPPFQTPSNVLLQKLSCKC